MQTRHYGVITYHTVWPLFTYIDVFRRKFFNQWSSNRQAILVVSKMRIDLNGILAEPTGNAANSDVDVIIMGVTLRHHVGRSTSCSINLKFAIGVPCSPG